MRVQVGDSVVYGKHVGIVERRDGGIVTLRLPNEGNRRSRCSRDEVRPLAVAMFDARKRGTKFSNDLSLTGKSTLAELVETFGYATQQLRQESLNKVVNQLARAGLIVIPATELWGRDDKFELQVREVLAETVEVADQTQELALQPMLLPEVFWPTAFGLDSNLEIGFLRALMARDPILCLLHMPDDSEMHVWLQGTWEGMTSWAYHAAQRFHWDRPSELSSPSVCFGPAAMLHSQLKASVLNAEAPHLRIEPHSLNLVTLKKESEIPVDMLRLRATWPGPVFEFKPHASLSSDQLSADEEAIVTCLFAVAGSRFESLQRISPLKALLWSKEACSQILARASTTLGGFLAGEAIRTFKGSNESATALALKADLANWIKKTNPDASLKFEKSAEEQVDEWGNEIHVNRVDLFVEGLGQFEVETLLGSGPMECFYHKKVFSRLSAKDAFLWLVVPNEAILWAGPYLADLAHHLASGERGRVVIRGTGDAYFEIQGRALEAAPINIEVPWDEISRQGVPDDVTAESVEAPIRLSDIAGYREIRERVDELIIWPERHRSSIRKPSRSSGILFFGPPGCGKSRLARAIAGELGHEVRLLSPSDLRGAYVGWGQIMVREQFDWVAEHEHRMLVIDELDAVARSRRMDAGMISDEMANVNELLVQLDRVSRLGRLVVGTTNFIGSMDDAVIRSGRFGRFIPVPPPDIEEAIAILAYYLRHVETAVGDDNQPRVQIPNLEEVQEILEPLFADNQQCENFFCGADLEEAVNRTYLRCLRDALAGVSRSQGYAKIAVLLTKSELARSLMSVPRSVRADAMKQFREDEARYCGGVGHSGSL